MILAAADGSSITDTVISGPFLLAGGLALAAGVVSFASPCVLPLVPGYLSYLVGAGRCAEAAPENAGNTHRRPGRAESGHRRGAQPGGGRDPAVRRRIHLRVPGRVPLVLGLAAALQQHVEVLTRLGGAIVIVMGLAMLGYARPLQREARIHARPTGRVWGAVLLGAFFAIGWTVCMGPTFAGVNALAISSDWNGNAWRGLLLVILYCIGLGLPFVALAFGFGWATTAVGVLRRHARAIQVIGGVLLIVLGVLMVTGLWGDLVAWLRAGTPTSGRCCDLAERGPGRSRGGRSGGRLATRRTGPCRPRRGRSRGPTSRGTRPTTVRRRLSTGRSARARGAANPFRCKRSGHSSAICGGD